MAPCQAQVSGENKHGVRQRQLTQDLYLHIYIASYISLSFPPLALDSCIQDYQLYRLCAPSRRSTPRLTKSMIGGIGYYKYYSLFTIVYNYLQPFATVTACNNALRPLAAIYGSHLQNPKLSRRSQALSDFIIVYDSPDPLLHSLVVSRKSRPGWPLAGHRCRGRPGVTLGDVR